MTNPSFFNQFLIWPILNILVFFYKVFLVLGIPGAFGFAIITLTIFIRLLLYPLTLSQLKSAQKMAELKPHLDRLSKKHGKDKQRLQQEQLKLYKEAGVNPAAGCLPLILQMPVFIGLYQVFWRVLSNGNIEKIVSEINQVVYFSFLKISSLKLDFFGLNLAEKPSNWQKGGFWLLLVPVLTAFLQYLQTKMMTPVLGTAEELKKKQKMKKAPEQDEMAKMMQTQANVVFPLMIGFFAYSFPLGLSLYWNIFTLFGILQQHRLKLKTKN